MADWQSSPVLAACNPDTMAVSCRKSSGRFPGLLCGAHFHSRDGHGGAAAPSKSSPVRPPRPTHAQRDHLRPLIFKTSKVVAWVFAGGQTSRPTMPPRGRMSTFRACRDWPWRFWGRWLRLCGVWCWESGSGRVGQSPASRLGMSTHPGSACTRPTPLPSGSLMLK